MRWPRARGSLWTSESNPLAGCGLTQLCQANARLEPRLSPVMRLFLVGLILVLLVLAVAGWVVRPFTTMATWAAGLVEARF